MTAKKSNTSSVKTEVAEMMTGDISRRKNDLDGPYKVYLPTGRRDEDGVEIKEEYTDASGRVQQRKELEKEPFFKDVWFRKHYLTTQMEDELRKLRTSDEFSELFELPTDEVKEMPGEFEEIEEDGVIRKVPKTEPVMKLQRLTTRHLNASIHTLVRVMGKWDGNISGVPIPITVEDISAADLDKDIINAILDKHREITNPL